MAGRDGIANHTTLCLGKLLHVLPTPTLAGRFDFNDLAHVAEPDDIAAVVSVRTAAVTASPSTVSQLRLQEPALLGPSGRLYRR
jgi:hypothetical protein